MTRVAVVSAAGGAGRSFLTAALATEAARMGRFALAVEWDPQNLLSLHFGATASPRKGLATAAVAGHNWAETALRSDDGVSVLPYGRLDMEHQSAWESRMVQEPGWLAAQLARLDVPANGWVFVDSPRAPSALQASAAKAADVVLVVVRAEPAALARLTMLQQLCLGKPWALVVNAFDATKGLQQDVLAALIDRLPGRVAPHVIHQDEAVPASLAAQAALRDTAPHSQVAHDVRGLWLWLARRARRQLVPEAQHAAVE